ncbi:hypothetical protein [Corynebacterium sp. p3-SID1241]|uniref:hypothetical protein n=1 Tax=Corynebacterium sp. p3-SID1241 TaxID=2916102 RepID=UPI0021A54F28|nr:hypothetical protein [Corynebacterium sp. p3-SID1241]MCT1428950.1 hypothetical protein [Corynebacterium sp. p3-SID1241]
MSFARKSALLSAATALTVTLAAPAAAHADAVDNLLAKMPAGQISCSQAKQYWTNSADYNQKKSQALAVATVHPRGNEVRDAIGRMDEAIARCGLNGTTGQGKPVNTGGQRGNAPAPKPAPAPAPAKNAKVIELGTIPGQPTVDVPFLGQTFRIPDAAKIAQNAVSQFQLPQIQQLQQLSSF